MTQLANPALAHALGNFRKRLALHYGTRLEQLILFGSHARGEARQDSDVDVAVILDQVRDHTERIWPMALAGELGEPLISPVVMSRCELELLRSREDLLAAHLDREGVIL